MHLDALCVVQPAQSRVKRGMRLVSNSGRQPTHAIRRPLPTRAGAALLSAADLQAALALQSRVQAPAGARLGEYYATIVLAYTTAIVQAVLWSVGLQLCVVRAS